MLRLRSRQMQPLRMCTQQPELQLLAPFTHNRKWLATTAAYLAGQLWDPWQRLIMIALCTQHAALTAAAAINPCHKTV
jgi:hypothetical protein